MAGSLKEENALGLFGLMTANLVAFCALAQGTALMAGNWVVLARSIGDALPAAIGLGLTGIINAQLTPEAKASIVYVRKHNPLPGCQAFTRYAKADPRVDVRVLEDAFGPLPSKPGEQNALWYRIFKSVESDPAVMQAHRAFLFARDYACLALMMIAVLGVASLLQFDRTATALLYVGALALQFALAAQAARNHGRRLVTTVLATAAAGQDGGIVGRLL